MTMRLPISKLYTKSQTSVQVINTTTETDLFNFTVDPSAVTTGDFIRIRGLGNQFNNKGSAGVSRHRFYLSGTNVVDTGASAPSIPNVVTVRGGFNFEFMIEVRSTTAANIGGYMTWSNQLAGGVLLEAYSGEVMVESATIALGSGIGCRLSVQLAVADAAYDQRLINYTAEILKG